MNTKTLNHSVKRAITGVTLFILLVTKTLYGVTDHRPTLKELFHNPVNLNKVTEERITRSLRLLLLSELKIKRIIIYVHTIKKRKLESFESMVQDRIITSQEAVILSRFTFLKERSGYHLFEEELESEYSSSGDRVHDPDFKINLNRFESETLLSLRFMDEKTVRAITRFRVLNGRFNSIYELLLIPELDPVIFLRLKPFLVRLKADKQKNKSSLELRIRRGKQQLEPVQENKHYYYTRANISLGNGIDLKLSGIKSEDQVAGYPASLLSGSLGDFNYYRQYSIALYLEKKELPISFLALGDYYLRFGQHLLFGGTFPAIIDKIDTHPIKKRDYGISSFQNPNRIGALRGLAFAVPVGQFKITAFSFSNSYELTKGRFLNDGVNVSYEGMVTDISVMA
ncbi:MAG: helix-hairpin-helix domain-containing protein, partial [Spirochaetota bacterium]|nr:helix-hairpin-helix domain-containing protein [Spirochaetota bacterium]